MTTNGNGAMRLFELEGSSLYLHSGNPIKERIAKDVVLQQNPQISEDRLFTMTYAGFWILEGSLGSHDLDTEKYPSLNSYLEQREQLTLLERWALYVSCVDTGELDFLRQAYDATRGHVLETMTGTPLIEKKD